MVSKLEDPLMAATLSHSGSTAQAVDQPFAPGDHRRGAVSEDIAHQEMACQAEAVDDVRP